MARATPTIAYIREVSRSGRKESGMEIRVDDLSGDATLGLVARHLDGMREYSPPESVHALDAEALRDPAVTFWSAWVDGEIAGIGALKTLDADRGEIKSMRVDDRFRGAGVGRALLRHILAEARERGMTSLWLETGTTPDFAPAQRLYESEGFRSCDPFDGYAHDPFSRFMTRRLD
jgi:putative acetyltransferase